MADNEQTFTDIWGRIFKIVDEEYNIKEEDIKKWDILTKTLDLPPINFSYSTFVHPEGNR